MLPASPLVSRQLLGWLAVLGSTGSLYLATAIIRWSRDYVDIDAPFFVFSRFLCGFFVVSLTMIIGRHRFRPQNYHLLFGRTITNTISVFCFYKAVQVSTLAEANILNMTYPLFVTIFSWFLIKEQRDKFGIVIAILAFLGIWLIISPGDMEVKYNSLWGLASGATGGVSIIYLNLSRRYHDSHTILLFMFTLGSMLMFLFFHQAFFWPNATEFLFLFTCSIAGVLGQYLLTFGFLYVTAVEGSVISSSRILIAALVGPFIGDPALSIAGWIGALLLFFADSALALRKFGRKTS